MSQKHKTGVESARNAWFLVFAMVNVLAFSTLSATTRADSSMTAAPQEKVTGIGGFFFRAQNPEKLAKWYEQHLGVSQVPSTYEEPPWNQEAGPTVFAPFSANTEYFGAKSQSWMINFRVNDLNAMVAQLRAAGIEVEVEAEEYPNGVFARLNDPEGNPIQLWEPR